MIGYVTLPAIVSLAIVCYWLSLETGFAEKPLQAILVSQTITVAVILIAERLVLGCRVERP